MEPAYFNEIDPKAAAWIRELYPDATVDERSIADVAGSDDVLGLRRCHFFAGIAGWELALELAGWDWRRPVWTGSCPCQPLSSAGRRGGEKDERHLWPEFFRLIGECRPELIFGEQVASADGREWLDGISLDLEELGYAVGAADLSAACVGAPHIRQRIYWVATDGNHRCRVGDPERAERRSDLRGRLHEFDGPDQGRSEAERASPGTGSDALRLADAESPGLDQQCRASGRPDGQGGPRHGQQPAVGRGTRGMAARDGQRFSRRPESDGETERPGEQAPRRVDACRCGLAGGLGHPHGEREGPIRGIPGGPGTQRQGSADGFWSDFDLIPCRDGKHRRIPRQARPGVQPVAHGLPVPLGRGGAAGYGHVRPLTSEKVEGRVGLLKGSGNAIVPELAALFIRAFLEADR